MFNDTDINKMYCIMYIYIMKKKNEILWQYIIKQSTNYDNKRLLII